MTNAPFYLGWAKEENGKHHSRTGMILLEEILKQAYGIILAQEENPIERTEYGKPFLVNHPDIYFNITHSKEYVMCIAGKNPVGIDLQYIKKNNVERLAKRCLTQEEWEEFEKTEEKERLFCRFWTKKESYLKYTGEGIRKELRTLRYEDVHFQEMNFQEGYVVTICMQKDCREGIISVDCPHIHECKR